MRADAVRNRQAILQATEDLLARYRPDEVSMERVAAAAGVGKGTVFHRFGSRMGLMTALMLERARALDDAIHTGPPPLGPGAPPRERLIAFLDAVVTVVARNKGLLAALGHAAHTVDPADRDRHPVYRSWHSHVRGLLAEADDRLDAEVLAHVLLASVQSDFGLLLLDADGGARLRAALRALVLALLAD